MEKREAIQAAASQSAIEHDFNLATVVAPRVGKCKIVLQAIGDRFDEWSICIATPREDVNKTWLKEYMKWFMILELNGNKLPDPICFASLKNIPQDLDLLVCDEYHMLSVNQMRTIKKKKPKRIWMLSGTSHKYTRAITKYQLDVDVKFEYTLEEAIRDRIISNFHVYIVKLKLDNQNKNITVGAAGNKFKVSEHQSYTYYDTLFNDFRMRERGDPTLDKIKMITAGRRSNVVYNAVRKKLVAKKIIDSISDRVLAFTTRTDIADYLSPYSHHSKNKKEKNLQRFMNEEINTLAVVQMSDVGVTIPNLKTIVVHQLQSNSETSIQRFLRACNLDEDKEARVIVLAYGDTMDESWVNQAIEGVPTDKVTWMRFEELDELLNKLR